MIEVIHSEAERYATRERLSYTVLLENAGKAGRPGQGRGDGEA